MITYPAEQELEHVIRSTAQLQYCLEIVPSLPLLTVTAGLENFKDLYHLRSVMVSTGWNLNDDYFDPQETWSARYTPVNKPFNYEHNESDIIGHITAVQAVDFSHQPIPDDYDSSQLTSFHLLTHAVLYKYRADKSLQERIDKIIAEVAENKWFVSMECVFNNFDYAIIKPDQSFATIQRTAESAFLTKHLRAYNGSGIYQDHKIGRCLRDIVFTGKGIVRRPANPASVIFANFQNPVYISDKLISNATEFFAMADDKQINELKEDRTKLEAKVSELDKSLAALATKNSDLESEKSDLQSQLNDAMAAFKKVKDELDVTKTELVKLQASQTKLTRIDAFMKETEASREEAEELVDSLAALSDEAFANYMTKTKNRMKKKKEEAAKGGIQSTIQQVLNNSEPKPEPTLGTNPTEGADKETLRKSMAAYLIQKGDK